MRRAFAQPNTPETRAYAKVFVAVYVVIVAVAMAECEVDRLGVPDAKSIRNMVIVVFEHIAAFAAFDGVPFSTTPIFSGVFTGRMPWLRAGVTLAVQMTAAVAAIATVAATMPRMDIAESLVLALPADYSAFRALRLQTVTSASATFIIEASRLSWTGMKSVRPFYLSCVIMTMAIMTRGVTGMGSFNILRPTAPAVMAGAYDNLWIYWAGDILGAAIGVLLTRLLHLSGIYS